MKPLWFMFLVLQAFLSVEFSWSQNVNSCEIGGLTPNLYLSGLTPTGGTMEPGHKLRFLCGPGYQLDGSTEIECLPTGQWSASFPSCSATKCPAIHADNNVQILGDAEEATSGNVVRFSCKSSAEILDGSQEIYCKDDGEWSGPVPTCKAIRCSVPHIEHGRVRGAAQEYKEQEILDFICDPSYKPAERPSRCTKFAGKADWSPTPACILIKCELPLASIPGTTYDPPYKNMFSPGEIVRVSCGEKHWILDTQTTVADVTCGINGNWNMDIVCREVTCPQNIQEEHLYYAFDAWGRTKLGDRVRYYCDGNSDPGSSDRMATCTRDGWTPKPLCRGRQCENPNIENSRITSSSRRTYYNSDRLTYQCLGGNQESVTITCAGGAWEGIKQCSAPLGCSAPPALEDGDTKLFISSATVYQHGEKVEYICVDKYTMDGDPFKTCDNGVWKGDMRCLKPCTVNEELMRQHGIVFRYVSVNKLYAPHEDHIPFSCERGKSLVGTVPFRVQCNDGQMILPTCQ